MQYNKTKTNIYIFNTLVAVSLLLSFQLVTSVLHFTNTHTITLRSPLRSPIVISVNAEQAPVVSLPEPMVYLDAESELKDYIQGRFGSDSKIAYAVMMAESHGNPQAYHVNNNLSLDLGCMQLNSIHFTKATKIADLLDCHKNIDMAYAIFKSSGWNAWSTYNNKSYLKYLTNN